MARRMPARYTSGPKKGQFKPRGAKKRRRRRNPASTSSAAPKRTRTMARKSNPRRTKRRRSTRRRRNPGMPSVVRQLTGGVKDAAAIVGGEAAARALPSLAKLPKEGALGLAVQGASALVAGFLAHKAMGREVGRLVLAGGLSAPLKTAIVAAKVPFLAPALSPATGAAQLGAYKGLRAYVLPSGDMLGRYVKPAGMGAYVRPRDSRDRGDLNGYDVAVHG